MAKEVYKSPYTDPAHGHHICMTGHVRVRMNARHDGRPHARKNTRLYQDGTGVPSLLDSNVCLCLHLYSVFPYLCLSRLDPDLGPESHGLYFYRDF